MLLFTVRPMVILLGLGSCLLPAASVLRGACLSGYGWDGSGLEANGTKVLSRSPVRESQAVCAVVPRPGGAQAVRWRGSGPASPAEPRPATRSTYWRCWL